MNLNNPHWHVLGAGAIGCLFGAALQQAGSPITLILRHGEGRKSVSVQVQRKDTQQQLQFPVYSTAEGDTIHHLLVTTKAYDVRAAVARVKPHLAADCTVLLLVNGMGLAEQLQDDLPQRSIYCGTTTQGAYRLGPQQFQHAGEGETRIGRSGQKLPAPWFDQWASAVESCVWDTAIEAALWSKLAINCIINPLTALHGCRNGELGSRAELADQVQQLSEEVVAISAAAGFTDTAANLAEATAAVIAGTANNRSSMLQDIEQGLPTEIDYITGYLLRVAAQHGVAAPLNTALFERIHERVEEAYNRAH